MAGDRVLVVRAGTSTHRVRVVSDGAVEIDGRRVAVEVSAIDESTFVVTVGRARHTVHVAGAGERAWAMAAGETFEIEPSTADPAAPNGAAPSGSDEAALSAPMPATVTAVLVRPGARVAPGEPLVRLEAMKMEIVVRAPCAGRIAAVDCRAGDLVQPGRPLVTLQDDPDAKR